MTFVDVPMGRVSVQILAKNAIDVVERTTLRKNADPRRDLVSLSQGMTQGGKVGPMEENAHTDAMCMKLRSVRKTAQCRT